MKKVLTTENLTLIKELILNKASEQNVASLTPYAKLADVQSITAQEVAKIVANAPENLNTLKEIADFITNNATKAGEIENKLTTLETSAATKAELETKADKTTLADYALKSEVAGALEFASDDEVRTALA